MTYSIPGVEIFSVGTWNDEDFTMEDLEELVRAFNENKEHYRPFLKLGHNEEQVLLQKDGLPAAGWIDNVYIKGQTLCADFMHIPKKVYELIQAKAYSKVSCEIYFDCTVDDKKYPALLSAVALLGSDMPAVMNLDDILGMYKKIPKIQKDVPKIYSQIKFAFNNDNPNNVTISEVTSMSKTENEIKLELELKTKTETLAAQDKHLADIEASLAKFQKMNEALETEKLAAQKLAKDAEAKEKKAQLAQFTTELVANKLCTPGMKPLVEQLFEDEKSEFTVGEKKTASKQELVKEVLALFAKAKEVNFTESTANEAASPDTEDAQEAAVEKYMKDHEGVAYKDAVKAVFKKNPPKVQPIKLVQGE